MEKEIGNVWFDDIPKDELITAELEELFKKSNEHDIIKGLLMPKLVYRFRTALLNFGFADDENVLNMMQQIVSIEQPSISIDTMTLDKTIKLKLRNDVCDHVHNNIKFQIEKQRNDSAVFDIKITHLDINDEIFGVWELNNCKIQKVHFATMNYADNSAQHIILEIEIGSARYLKIKTNGTPSPEFMFETIR